MRKRALYSSSRPALTPGARASAPAAAASAAPDAPAASAHTSADTASPPARSRRLRRPTANEWLWVAMLVLATLLAWSLTLHLGSGQRRITQQDIDAAVLKTLSTQNLPSEYARAYENVRPSVVRVVSYVRGDKVKPGAGEKPGAPGTGKAAPPKKPASAPGPDEEVEFGVGTGVVIVDKGIILTNLHVVAGADRIKVTFHDGLEATAWIRSVQAENDLAVLQAEKIPDDLIAATLRSTNDLAPGDKVLAVGFPFGIGPSASGGVVSGLGRVFRSPEGKQDMKNLIQFDAAANPGNSGGPLVTMDGEVVGIVTAILNPTPARTFLGIGFAVPIESAASAVGLPPF